MSSACGNPACTNIGTLWCSACKCVRYCSKECQKEDWKYHKQSFFHKKLVLPNVCQEYTKFFPTHGAGIMITKISMESVREMVDSNAKNLYEDDLSTESLVKRWHEVSNKLINFYRYANPGDIYMEKTYLPYDTKNKPQQYRNTPPLEPAVLTNGTNVIDIGFVDFGIAIDAAGSIKHGEAPVVIYAFEKEPMCVAKCLVMLEMMNMPTTSPRSIVEVWMSTLWSEDTLLAFTSAVNVAESLQPEVKKVLKFWQQQSRQRISKDKAMNFWMLKHAEQMSVACMNVCNLTSMEERVALLRYELTGALYEDASTTIGSVVMCTENSDIGVNQSCESCLEAAPTSIHMPHLRQGRPLLDRVRDYFCGQVAIFAAHLRDGTLIFKPRMALLAPGNTELLDELRSLNPYVVSWSNVSDYMHPTTFHSLARHISGPETVHYLHSCNWTTLVYGVDVYDINENVRGYFFEGGMKICGIAQRDQGFAEIPISHYRNFVQIPLTRKYIKHYLRYFFKDQDDVRVGTCGGLSPISMPNPCLRSNETAHLIISYGDEVHFGENTYDYLHDSEQ